MSNFLYMLRFSEAMYQISMLDRLAVHCSQGVLTALIFGRLSPVCRNPHGKDAMIFGGILEQILVCSPDLMSHLSSLPL